ncbi:Type III restriction-modification system methylation subunit (plasmid) [Ligilactobacillus salivarius]|uniref:site-specific DNA-methyltransferase n=1 Tax=Ligilactobacillus salivarius TaxID=1624 RepID=UPI0013DDC7F9|nr:site-specific DNA-methyltransferase [Ligilactobacillus salivarius]QIG37378.1 Type III restriction-modification system methylation subunit [Ligilactobacillus salivarius]
MAIEAKVIEHIRSILEKFDNKYMLNGRIKKSKVIEDLDRYDHNLMEALLSDKLIHDSYTEKLANVEVFKVNQFIEMLEFKKYWEDSYTKYSNKIGLTAGGKFIDESTDVVLDFPFKDTVLKAGMSKEDLENSDDADEPFLNEIIAKPEIDELFEPKILVNARRYDNSNRGGYETSSISDDDNLIIKGNNLIALHSLKKKYAGKVKLIYLDPPYNTTKDFDYNDKFTHATWLTFMKSRLEIAWDLLAEDGTIWISIDDNESHYLKVLADSVFGRENFLNEVIWQRAYAPVNLKKTFSRSHDYIQVYAKNNSSNKELNRLPRSAEANSRYKNPDNDPRGVWQSDNLSVGPAVQANIYEITTPSGRKVLPPDGYSWRLSKDRLKEFIDDNRIWFGKDGDNVPRIKRFLSEVGGVVAQTLWTYQEVGHNQDAKKEIKALFEGQALFGTPKPEKLLQRILTLGSNKNDLVLDFFMGSATTQAVAMKMGRRFIGIEQMDYINTVSVPRLQKVIEGEQGGISKNVNWQGGGSFVYAELMEKNQGYLKDLQKSESIQELTEVYERMKENADIDFRLDLEKFEEEINNFNSLDERRRELIRILDKNQLYYNYANIDDENVRDLISDNDYKFNKSFYSD